MSANDSEARDSLLEAMALLGQTGAARGSRPTARELREYSAGGLAAERRVEIESQLAHDPDVLRAFIASSRAYARAPSAAAAGWRERLFGGWRLAASAAGAAALAVVAFVLNTGTGRPVPVADTRAAHTARPAAAPPARDWRRHAFGYGYENPGAFDRLTADAPEAFSARCDGGDCASEIDAMTAFGAAMAGVDAACRAAPRSAGPLDAAAGMATALKALRGRISDAAWAGRLEQMIRALDQPAGRACDVARQISRAANISH